MKILNLYAGIGGNRKKWEGKVTAIEMEKKIAAVYESFFKEDDVILGDAHQFLLDHCDEFDFIWSSPPCQKHSRMVKATRHKKKQYIDIALYQEIICLTHFFKGKWVVENVKPYYDPLILPTAIIGRHYFWSNFPISYFEQPSHPNFIQAESPAEVQALKDWLGLNYEGNIYYGKNHSPAQILRNCVHPDLGKHILNCAIQENYKPGPELITPDLFSDA